MDQKFSRSRSLRYRSGRSRASRVASQHVEKTVADSSSMTVVASEGGAIASVHVSSSSDDSVLENLRSELHEACKERLKAAEYGLVLLEEKEFLQQEVDRLEVQYESSRHEVDILNQVVCYTQYYESRTLVHDSCNERALAYHLLQQQNKTGYEGGLRGPAQTIRSDHVPCGHVYVACTPLGQASWQSQKKVPENLFPHGVQIAPQIIQIACRF